ncbi:XXYS1_4_G0030930.mRNA.1.CDS.1 [Saccharomyces cerevisiae]|nr:EM14S01-3B_G0028380.mRNA.1.CDS.1 [Saccharomyces cerevisiae]CAD6647373.1 XXYS1_4_G0030930.mRNA.1.CDS.1 [Saccharomyces cerevisiae]CAI4786203.1 CEI_1a_G0050140.mRNA.1.CDS.1 [Saccharomyces cerevisiae]CAI4793670.1 AMH_1a_G0050240.mRNA.1.CDS.1 [Saccharomyces cerevisiae]CAI6883593.1 AMH_1a_G0050240.mRNA.1.CDS.1 [Saccharomyces cerevisiae]
MPLNEKYERPPQPPPAYDPNHRPPSSSENSAAANVNDGQTPYHFRQDQYYNLNSKTSGAPIGSFDEAFPTENDNKPRWNDWPFTIFFLCTVGGFIAIAAITLRAWSQTYSSTGSGIYDGVNTGTLNTNAAILLVFVCIIALVFSVLGLTLCRIFPKQFIYCGMIINLVASLGTAIMYMSLRYWSAGIVFLVFTFMTAWCYWGMRSRIPLSVAVLKVVVDAMKKCPQIFFVSFVGALVASAFGFLFSAVIVATYIKYDPNSSNGGCDVSGGSCSHSKLIGVLVVVFFCGYYISEVIRNVIHCVISGVFGSWYYMSKSDQGMPRWPAFGALKRAMTYSFGSICFGSLLVALIDLLRQVLQMIRKDVTSSGGGQIAIQILFIVFDWIIGFLKWLAEYFNHYAYSFIALYGKPYLRAAKETWYMLREKGMDALINDNLINIALGLFSMFASYMTALFTFLYLRFTSPQYNSNGAYNGALMAFSFVIALQICNIATEAIRSGTATFFVALGNDPEVFHHSYPHRFDEIFRAYPDVLRKLSHQNV